MFVGWVISYSLNRLVKAVYICKTLREWEDIHKQDCLICTLYV